MLNVTKPHHDTALISRVFAWGFVGILSLGLAACGGSSATRDAGSDAAVVEDRGISSAEMEDIDSAATTQGLESEESFYGNALADPNDPNSPLAVRLIYFDYDSASVRSEFRAAIEAHAAYLAANPTIAVTLEGHADERGSREYNLALGERRALSVRKQLELLGAASSQIETVSYGEERPIDDGHDEQSYALNRRVEIIYR